MNFYVGQKVVCVDDTKSQDVCFWDCVINIRKGATYKIRGFDRERQGVVGIYLEGVFQRGRRGGPDHGVELAWHPRRFRPLDDLTASLAQTESERTVEERPEHINIPQHA